MRKLIFVLILTLLLSISALAVSEWSRTVSVTGGSAQRMSALLTTGGYAGSFQLDEYDICNPKDAANTLYIGQSDVDNTNGFPLDPGDCQSKHASSVQTFRDPTQVYLYVATTQNVSLSVTGR